ncbi:hypothetical protein ACP4OV_019056 [Aristida adscensionis]
MSAKINLRMATGDGENSYATNSTGQKKVILETRPVLQKAVEELYRSLPPGAPSTVVVADLGCSSGPNALLIVSEVLRAFPREDHRHQERADPPPPPPPRAREIMFFLNDLPGNDFNVVFQALEEFRSGGLNKDKDNEEEEIVAAPPYYVAGLPGSFYTRLLPCQSVHLFHSSYCLMWRSKVPEYLSRGTHLNEDSIYIGKTTPPAVVKLFEEQFKKDFELFLTLRHEELVYNGRMVLTFLCRKSEQMLVHGEVGTIWELLSEALRSLVEKDLVEKKKLSSFNLPFYAPSVDEVKALIKQNQLFDIESIGLFQTNWDPHDDSDGDMVEDCASSGEIITKGLRAVIEPLIRDHFGESILHELFVTFAAIVAKHLERGKAKFTVIVVSLRKAGTESTV